MDEDEISLVSPKRSTPEYDPMSPSNMGKAFWRDHFGEEYWRNYSGIGEDYTENLMENMPSFQELAKSVPEGKAALEGKSILCLGSAFGHELLHLQESGMRPHGVEISPYCLERLLPSAEELCTRADALEYLQEQPAGSYDYILASCLEYVPDEKSLTAALQHCRRVARRGLLLICVQADMDEDVENHVVAVLKDHAWWKEAVAAAGFGELSQDEFIQWAPIIDTAAA